MLVTYDFLYRRYSFRSLFLFFVNDSAPTGIYPYLHTHSLHDALPISFTGSRGNSGRTSRAAATNSFARSVMRGRMASRSEEHTSELQSLMRYSYAVFCLKKEKE